MLGSNGDGRHGRVNGHGHNGHPVSVGPAATAGAAITVPTMTDELRPLEVPSPPPDTVPRDWPERKAWLLHMLADVEMTSLERDKYIAAHYAFFLATSQPKASSGESQTGHGTLDRARESHSQTT